MNVVLSLHFFVRHDEVEWSQWVPLCDTFGNCDRNGRVSHECSVVAFSHSVLEFFPEDGVLDPCFQ